MFGSLSYYHTNAPSEWSYFCLFWELFGKVELLWLALISAWISWFNLHQKDWCKGIQCAEVRQLCNVSLQNASEERYRTKVFPLSHARKLFQNQLITKSLIQFLYYDDQQKTRLCVEFFLVICCWFFEIQSFLTFLFLCSTSST
jgi:hypothetical protein